MKRCLQLTALSALVLAGAVGLDRPLHAQGQSLLQSTLLNAVTSGTSQPIDTRRYNNLTVYIASTGTVSGGTLLIEEAFYDPSQTSIYSLTWSQVKSLTGGTDFGTNSQTAYHPTTGAFNHVRARVSSTITGGGTITVTLVGQ
jgi:hypothetical protein